jgi:hypothetical protein
MDLVFLTDLLEIGGHMHSRGNFFYYTCIGFCMFSKSFIVPELRETAEILTRFCKSRRNSREVARPQQFFRPPAEHRLSVLDLFEAGLDVCGSGRPS